MNIAPGMYAELPNGLQFDEARSEGRYSSPHTLHHVVVLACMYVCMYGTGLGGYEESLGHLQSSSISGKCSSFVVK